MNNTLVTVIGLLIIGALEYHALDLHIDGVALAAVIGIVAAAIGVAVPIRSPFEPPKGGG